VRSGFGGRVLIELPRRSHDLSHALGADPQRSILEMVAWSTPAK
jgi:hypothetical protein